MKITLIFPVYNRAEKIESAVSSAIKIFSASRNKYEIIIAEDGSTDNSYSVSKKVSKKYKNVSFIHSDRRLGKGLAIKNAIRHSTGDIIFFSDVDLSAGLEKIDSFISEIKKGNDICIGSRYINLSSTRRFAKRMIASRTYIFLVRLLFGIRLSDFQCGFKAFSRKAVPVALETKNNSWFWDTEFLIKAKKAGMKITEIPVSWKETEKTSVNIITVSVEMFSNLIMYRIRRFFS